MSALVDRGALAEGLTATAAADSMYTLMSPEVHRILTIERGWSPDEYERWLAAALRALLLPPPQQQARSAPTSSIR